MQKNIRTIFALLFGVLMIFGLSACQPDSEPAYEPESAAALWEKVDETMNTLESMEMTGTTQVVFFSNGYPFELNGSTYVLSTKECHYSEYINTVSSDELSMEETTTLVEAYYDGKMYVSNNNGVYAQKLCSEMTHEEYDQLQEGELTDEIEIADCTKAEFSKGEGDTWHLKFSGYTKKTIDKVLKTLLIADDVLGAPITDMEVSLIANKDFYVQKMEIVFIFASGAGEAIPKFSVTAEYSSYNTAVFDPAKLKTEEYTTVDDVRVMDTVSTALKERQDAPVGKFTLGIKTTYERQGMSQTSTEIDTVTYGRKNGAYSYSITAEMDGQSFLIQYQGGQQTVTADGQTHTAVQSESEAKRFIDSLINSARFDANAVTGVQKQGEDVYVLTCDQLDLTEYSAALAGNNIQLTAGNQQITVTFQNGKLLKIESKITLNGTEAGQSMTMVTESVVGFDDTEQSV